MLDVSQNVLLSFLIPIDLDAVNNEYSEYGEIPPGHIEDGIKVSRLV